MKRTLLSLYLIGAPLFTFAADIPSSIIENKNSNLKMCIERATNDCISTVCPNSSELDCDDRCQKAAENKCNSLQQE